ncbi:hypothetical protein WDW89_10535 [Deltaproteobacteria bacterium TL4]
MEEENWKDQSIILAELPTQHYKLLEKLRGLPVDQQKHIETIIDGLGAGKSKQQRKAAKNTVMTILNITPGDLSFLKQMKQLPKAEQEDLLQLVQDQLKPDLEVDTLSTLATSPFSKDLPQPATNPDPTPSAVESKPPEKKFLAELTPEEIEAPSTSSLVEFDNLEVISSEELVEVEPPELSQKDPHLDESKSDEDVLPDNDASRPQEAVQEEITVEESFQEQESGVELSASKIRISVLGTGLVISSEPFIPNLDIILEKHLGFAFRSVFGLLKSVDKKAALKLEKSSLATIIEKGILDKGRRYQVEYDETSLKKI